jgi:hypothetical protein
MQYIPNEMVVAAVNAPNFGRKNISSLCELYPAHNFSLSAFG